MNLIISEIIIIYIVDVAAQLAFFRFLHVKFLFIFFLIFFFAERPLDLTSNHQTAAGGWTEAKPKTQAVPTQQTNTSSSSSSPASSSALPSSSTSSSNAHAAPSQVGRASYDPHALKNPSQVCKRN